MASRKDMQDGERFRVKPAAPRSRAGVSSQRFVSQVLKATSKAGAKASAEHSGRPESTFGRGRVMAAMARGRLAANARRVVIKSRFVVLKKAAAKSITTHLRYIERDGVTRDGQRGQAYGAATDAADLKAFEQRGQGDRHQFRFIVSVEDAEQLEDLRGYTRELMQRMEVDLQTRLDWVAVDHWDTDDPHTHVVLRGSVGEGRAGRDLVIAPDYMAHGMRMRASEIATEWLGPRTELEIRQALQREVVQERLTSLDRTLLRQAGGGVVDLTQMPEKAANLRQRQTLLRARLHQLEAMGLAERLEANRWRLAPALERSLTAMGERSDILRTMHRAMKNEQRELAIEASPAMTIIGRIAGKGLADELHERGYLMVDGIDGRAHYLKLLGRVDLAAFPIGGIVEAKPPAQEKAVDRNILAAVNDGIYTTANHQAQLARTGDRDPKGTAEAHLRRLEALRRSGLVRRVAEGVWAVPPDLLQKTRQHDAQRVAGHRIELRSHLPIEQQIKAMGVTWLDRNLVAHDPKGSQPARQGFGAQVREAMTRRVDFLAGQGLAESQGRRVLLARNLLATLRERELASVGQDLQRRTGTTWRQLQDGQRVSGIYRQSVQLVSGRFAMLGDDLGFSLVPWRPVIERRLGQPLAAMVHGSTVTWDVGRHKTLSL
jgi:type IV secretory pathway VirD2 relaxase